MESKRESFSFLCSLTSLFKCRGGYSEIFQRETCEMDVMLTVAIQLWGIILFQELYVYRTITRFRTDVSIPFWDAIRKHINPTFYNNKKAHSGLVGENYNNHMKNKTIFKSVCGILAIASLSACSGSAIEGEWVEPIPGMENQVQGVHLQKGGRASSINMATLQYEKWEKKGDKLILSGKSLGNGQTIPFSDTLTVEKLTDSELSLKRGDMTILYKKR